MALGCLLGCWVVGSLMLPVSLPLGLVLLPSWLSCSSCRAVCCRCCPGLLQCLHGKWDVEERGGKVCVQNVWVHNTLGLVRLALLCLLCRCCCRGLMSAFCPSNFSSQLGFCLLCSKHVGLTNQACRFNNTTCLVWFALLCFVCFAVAVLVWYRHSILREWWGAS